jgi:xanthine dehydrogenase YagS FAD-binding subunit
MTRFPASVAEAVDLAGPYRAAGTDLGRQRRLGLAPGEPVDLSDVTVLRGMERVGSDLRIGALVTLRELAANENVRSDYQALAEAAAAVANPNVRALATVGGNVLQQVRCDYFSHPNIGCLRKGGVNCPARDSDDSSAVCFDTAPCAAPHPSTLAAALLCYDARADVDGKDTLDLAKSTPPDRYAVGSALEPGSVLTAFRLPAPWPGERACYLRVAARALNDWPMVEILIRVAGSPQVQSARVIAGAVAPTPLRMRHVEDALVGQVPSAGLFAESARLSTAGARPLSGTRYKLLLLQSAIREGLHRCWPEVDRSTDEQELATW